MYLAMTIKHDCYLHQSHLIGISYDNKKYTHVAIKHYIYTLVNNQYKANHFSNVLQIPQENKDLFKADPASEVWRSYLEYIDEMVVDGLHSYIGHSLHFFLDNMDLRPNQAPLFEAQFMLSSSGMNYIPSLEQDAGDGLYDIIEGLVGDIFKTSVNISRVAAHVGKESYQV